MFKQVNDMHGHFAGDQVLKEISDLIRWRTRGSDISARMGGDEFAFILPKTSVSQGKIFAQELLDSVREHGIVISADTTLKVTLSIGVAQLSDDIQSIEALYGAADKALYESKHRGRNQVTGMYKQEFV
jgi:diguanylate cyclase (GGDEF)-like protein